jgi:hypothetical protein
MTQFTLDTEIRSKIDAFLEELSALVKKTALDSVHAALGNGAAPARRRLRRPGMKVRVGRPAKSATSRGGTRSTEEVGAMAERIAAFVRSNPGARLETIAAGLGTPSKVLKLPVIKLLGTKTLRKTGEKRGTQYFVGGRSGTTRAKSGRKARRKKA